MGPLTKILFVIGPTAGGKSTFINLFIEHIVNHGSYKASDIHFLNDYSILSKLFIEDDSREINGSKRLYSERRGQLYGVTNYDVLEIINSRLTQQILNLSTEFSESSSNHLIISELSRSGESAYKAFFCRFPPALFKRSCIIYLSVEFREALHRNKHRQNYSLPDANLAEMNSGDDWEKLAKTKDDDAIDFGGVEVPYLVIDNNQRWPVIDGHEKEIKEKLNSAADFLLKQKRGK